MLLVCPVWIPFLPSCMILLVKHLAQLYNFFSSDRLIPVRLMRQWKAQFVEGKPFWTYADDEDQNGSRKSIENRSVLMEESEDTAQLLDDLDFTDYRVTVIVPVYLKLIKATNLVR